MMPVLKLLSKEKGVIEGTGCEYRYSLLGTKAGNLGASGLVASMLPRFLFSVPQSERRVCFEHVHYAFERANGPLENMMRISNDA